MLLVYIHFKSIHMVIWNQNLQNQFVRSSPKISVHETNLVTQGVLTGVFSKAQHVFQSFTQHCQSWIVLDMLISNTIQLWIITQIVHFPFYHQNLKLNMWFLIGFERHLFYFKWWYCWSHQLDWCVFCVIMLQVTDKDGGGVTVFISCDILLSSGPFLPLPESP